MSNTDPPAKTVLAEYLRLVRQTDPYVEAMRLGEAAATTVIGLEMKRLLDAVGRHDRMPMPRYGSPEQRDFPLYVTLPDGDMVYGHGSWTGERGDEDREPIWRFGFVERHADSFQGYSLNPTLHPDGSGCVWLGVCNNSARYDTSDPIEAWALWSARLALGVSR